MKTSKATANITLHLPLFELVSTRHCLDMHNECIFGCNTRFILQSKVAISVQFSLAFNNGYLKHCEFCADLGSHRVSQHCLLQEQYPRLKLKEPFFELHHRRLVRRGWRRRRPKLIIFLLEYLPHDKAVFFFCVPFCPRVFTHARPIMHCFNCIFTLSVALTAWCFCCGLRCRHMSNTCMKVNYGLGKKTSSSKLTSYTYSPSSHCQPRKALWKT